MLLGILGLLDTHIAYPVVVQTKRFGHALRIDTSAGRNFFDAARHLQPMRSSLYRSDKLLEYALGIGAAYGRERPARGGYGQRRSFLCNVCSVFVSTIG